MPRKHQDDTPEDTREAGEVSEETEASEADASFQDRYFRAVAELENQRKRFDEERKRLSQFSMARSALDLLPVIDNLERATSHLPGELKDNQWVQGVLHIERQLSELLATWGIQRITTKQGDRFDATVHEAISTTPAHDGEEDIISQVVLQGYMIGDRVLRATQVIVTAN